jgi:hypothetical protein
MAKKRLTKTERAERDARHEAVLANALADARASRARAYQAEDAPCPKGKDAGLPQAWVTDA